MNPLTASALINGQKFAKANPKATPKEVDEASPRFNPMRTAFQDGAYSILANRTIFAVCTKDELYNRLDGACKGKDRKTIDLIVKELASRK